MKNNYNKLIAFVLLALISVSSQALLYKNQYFVWTNDNVTENSAGMGELAIPGLKSLSRADTAQFWNSGEPNNSSSREHCATQSKNGGWNDTRCDASRRLACFNGTDWAVSPTNVDMNNYWSTQLPPGCPTGYSFAAPMNLDQKLALDAVIPSGDVWINAYDNDRGVNPPAAIDAKEGVWVFNRGSTSLFGFDWSGGAPEVNGTKNCASIDPNGKWTAENCSQPRAVVCARQDFSAFQVVNANAANTMDVSTEEMHEICRTQVSEPGQQWMFAAPRSLAENTAVVAALAAANTTGPAWINAIGNRTGETWQTNLDLTNWAAGEPNFSNGQCAVARASDGKWQMADCDSSAKLLCYNPNSTGNSNWIIRNAFHQFSNQALDACSRPNNPTDVNNTFSEYQLVTPITESDRVQASNELRTGSGLYWLNLKYIADTESWLRNDKYKKPEFNGGNPQKAVWYHVFKDGDNNELYGGNLTEYYTGTSINIDQASELNKGVTAYFADKEPNGGDKSPRSSCIQLYSNGAKAGLWDDTNCTNQKRAACFDGYEWAISPSSIALGQDSDSSENISAAHNACAAVEKDNGVAGNFVFAAPRSFAQSQQLLTVARESGANDIWINMHSKKYKRVFVLNSGADVLAPFWNPNEPNNASPGEDCAVQQSTSKWNDLSCTSAQPVACYSPYEEANGTWKITAATYQYSDTLTKLCENEYGAQYKFYAPETLSQMRDLKAVMVTAGVSNAYINANDIAYEGTWLMNQGINNWAIGQQPYANDNKSCVSANAIDGQWSTQSCSSELAVACTTGSSWKFTAAKVNLANFANGQDACSAEFGQGHIFKAPRSLSDAEEIQYSAKLAGLGADYWINGNRLETPTTWKWNQSFVKTPVWGEGQPSDGIKNSCALLNNNTQAAWENSRCDIAQNHTYLCRNGSQWQVSTIKGNLEDFSSGTTACSGLGAGWQFAAPKTYNENVEAKNAMAGESQVWLNASDAMKQGEWILNSAPVAIYPNWAASLQPGNCAYQKDDGKLYTIDCSSAEENAWACTNGSSWRVTASKGKVDSFAQGHKACFKEYGADFIFAAPLTKDDAIKIDFARSLTATENASLISKVWLNMTTGGSAQIATNETPARKFRRNLPFTNWDGLAAGNEPAVGTCAYKNSTLEGVNNPWVTSNCSSSTAHYACTNGSVWAVATSKGRVENGVVEIVPTTKDYWSYERGNSMCKEQFDRSFYFSAPVTAAEEFALDTAIRNTQAQTKRVWINTYSVGGFSSFNNNWFVNRLKLGVWQKPVFRDYNTSDCAILHKDDGIDGLNGSWTDVPCKSDAEKYAFACYKGAWSIKGSGDWEEGFAVCAANDDSMFAVPRTPDEMQALQAEMGTEPVWINLTDNSLESQWIANRLRFTWWDENEPSNFGNRDCARVRSGVSSNGKWYAGKCSIEAAPFACRSTDGGVQWSITESEGIWSDGFGACEREFPGSLFMAPEGFASMSAKADQEALASVAKTAMKDPWINLSDQDVEGDWRAHRAFSDWGTSSPFDEARDCGYLDRSSKGVGTWFADSCKYTANEAKSRGYACTDGYQWKIINETATTDMHWSGGFLACREAGLRFAAPTNAFENTKLKLAMELHSEEPNEIWINAHDRFVEGEWQLNGPEVNFAPVIDVSETAIEVSENTASIQLKATLTDDEEMGIASATWSLVSNRGAITGKDASVADFNDIEVTNIVVTHDSTNGSATVTAKYSTPVLFKEDRILRFKVTATDIAPSAAATAATAESFVEVRVLGPLVAAWDFNNISLAYKDITEHGHDALNTTANPFPRVVMEDGNGVLKLESSSQMIVPGKASDPENGIEYPADNYTIAFRMSVEEPADSTSPFRNILQKGETASVRQPLISLMSESDKIHTSHNTDATNVNANTAEDVNTLQWINVIYVLNGTDVKLYIDGEEVATSNFNALLPQQNDGDLYIGMGPVPSNPSFVGFIDDIQVYNRALTIEELDGILPEPSLGSVHFLESNASVDEFLPTPTPSTFDIKLERTRGTNGPLTVYVDFDEVNSTATLGELEDMDTASHEADLALINHTAGQGVPVTWADGEKGEKLFQIKLDNADDDIREGTETARFIIKDLGGAKLGLNKEFNLRLLDKTPNPYGNFSVSIDGNSLKRVSEDSSAQKICFARESGKTGEVVVNYLVTGVAVETAGSVQGDFSYGTGSIIPTEEMNSGVENMVVFADGEGGETEADRKCIIIEPFNNPLTGESDKDYSVQITRLSHATDIDPILTDLNAARLVIYDYSPGEFAFSASSYTCKEPNTASTIPEGIRPEVGAVCEITVERLNTGNTAPAAELNVIAENSANYTGGITYTYTPQLNFPAVDAFNPKDPAAEIQTITVVIANNNVQDEDLDVQFTIQGTSDPLEEVAGGRGSAVLRILDITEPALVKLTRDKAEINEGEAVVYTVSREGNLNTYFNFNYNVLITPNMGKPFDYHIDTSNGIAQSGSLSFESGVNTTHTLTFNSIDTPENSLDYVMQVTLNNSSNNNVVGFGDYESIGKSGNQVVATNTVKNTRDLVADNYSVTIEDLGSDPAKVSPQTFSHNNGAIANAGEYLAVHEQQVPDTRQIRLALKIPKGLHIDSGVGYSWKLLNPDGTNASWHDGVVELTNPIPRFKEGRNGSIPYDAAGANKTEDYIVITRIDLPFVAQDTDFKLQLDINGNTEVFSKAIEFTVKPLYRRLKNDANNRCLRGHLTDTLVDCGNKDQWPNLYWIWHSEKSFLISLFSIQNNETAACIDIPATSALSTTNARMRECASQASRTATFHSDKTFRIDNTVTCRYSLNNNKIMRKNNCSNNEDRQWTWID